MITQTRKNLTVKARRILAVSRESLSLVDSG